MKHRMVIMVKVKRNWKKMDGEDAKEWHKKPQR